MNNAVAADEKVGSVAHAVRILRPFFDAARYAFEYPDINGDSEELLLHFCERGWKEGRNPNAGFDTVFYLEQNPDVANVSWNPYFHFIFAGYKENRRTFPAVMPRETAKRILGKDAGGWVELITPAIDVDYYISQFRPPLDRAVNPVAHFAFRGWLDKKNPNSTFDIDTAVKSNPELHHERLNPLVCNLVTNLQAKV